eukprot:gb/GEZN01011238.1/.p1 GENE.gb/GEZN01011238.1/~~gb/GEZN01011238.1/.p1  ORF type:complete len:357 (+),score=36.01 gb/GEZN01011238.1/:32-1102(+)
MESSKELLDASMRTQEEHLHDSPMEVKGRKNVETRYLASDGSLLIQNDPIRDGRLRMPSFLRVAFTIIYGEWLKLGDMTAWNQRSKDSLLTELNNIGLTAALMVTVEFSVVFLLLGQPWLDALHNLGLTNATEHDAKIAYDIWMVMGINSITCTVMSMIYAILLMLIIAEMNEAEISDYAKLMGTTMDHAFKLFFAGLMMFAFLVGSNMIIFTATWGGRITLIVFCAVPVVVIALISLTPAMYNLYKVKLTRQGKTHFGPIVMKTKAIQDLLLDFLVALENPEFLSVESFQHYLAEAHIKKNGYSAAIAPATQLRVDHWIESTLQAFLKHDFTAMTPTQMEDTLIKEWAAVPLGKQ